ncbi:phage tail protein [Phascolarctobacterium sp.]|uniref:phage tail protein n=1 Tax=Phascolarctobacterium sp. TaxID=2049039 RepID=UPI002A80C6ED|nr:phage tail protein [Phascolarctobacterium sp.]MDY5044992.1 phage tail protein [Phascolarctobacterium sp.]
MGKNGVKKVILMIFKKHKGMNTLFGRYRGGESIFVTILTCIIISVMGVSLTRLHNASFMSLISSETSMQAQHFAKAKMDYLVFRGYNNLSTQAKTKIDNSDFKDAVTLGNVSTDSSGINKRTVTVSVYNGDEALPRATLQHVFYSNDVDLYVRNDNSPTNSISVGYNGSSLVAKVDGNSVELGGGVPIGTIITWPVSTAPSEKGIWLECNGQSFDSSKYPKLYSVLGSNKVPNYQGMFLRGYGSQSFIQNNGSIVGNTTTVHSSGSLGMIQGDATRVVQGSFSFAGGQDVAPSGVFENLGHQNITASGSTDYGYDNPYFNNTRVVPTANEIRPVNIAVKYFIKAA